MYLRNAILRIFFKLRASMGLPEAIIHAANHPPQHLRAASTNLWPFKCLRRQMRFGRRLETTNIPMILGNSKLH